MPLALTDDQLATVFDAATPLLPADRNLFLRDVAAALDGQQIGDGLVARTCREIQRRYWTPPLDTSHTPVLLKKIGRGT
jgi:hypothetical protein